MISIKHPEYCFIALKLVFRQRLIRSDAASLSQPWPGEPTFRRTKPASAAIQREARDQSIAADHYFPVGVAGANLNETPFSGRGQNKISVTKGPDGGSAVDCVMQSEGIAETWHIAKIDPAVAYGGVFDSWTQALLAADGGGKLLKGKQGVEAMGVVDALAQTVTPSKRAGWVATGGQLAYYGVADAGAWRITYIATGKPDTVKFLAPMVWLSGLGQIAQFKPVNFER